MKHKIATALMYILNLFPFSIKLAEYIPLSEAQSYLLSINAPLCLLAYLCILIGISIANYFFFNSYQKVLSAQCVLGLSFVATMAIAQTDGSSIAEDIKVTLIIITLISAVLLIVIPSAIKKGTLIKKAIKEENKANKNNT